MQSSADADRQVSSQLFMRSRTVYRQNDTGYYAGFFGERNALSRKRKLYVVLCDNILEAVNDLLGLSQLPTSRNHDAGA